MDEESADETDTETPIALGAFIVANWPDEPPPCERPIRFRRAFEVRRDVEDAELAITACGLFTVHVNGVPVGDHVLDPGWTSYRHRHRVIRHDVTHLLVPGPNVMGVMVAEGWYRGRLGFEGGKREIYGSEIGPVARLVITHGRGPNEIVETDVLWRADPSAILSSGLYDGETLDVGLLDEWTSPGYDATSWAPVRTEAFDTSTLIAPKSPPVRRIEELAPVSIGTTETGTQLVDFGQNVSGRLRVVVPAAEGRVVTIRHAEVLDNGVPAYRPLRLAAATDRIILGDRSVTWEPEFTIHGFRYAEFSDWPGTLSADHVSAIVCHTDMEQLGEFECSDPLLNRLHANVRWSTKGNMVDIPTDCPQRDERLGWTGDIAVFAPTACFLFDCASILESWLEDLALEQAEFGTVPPYVPFFPLLFPALPTAGWGDAAVLVPWAVYRHFGDAAVLTRQYPSMCAWVDQVAERAGERLVWDGDWQLGDWLDPQAPPDRPADGRTDPGIVATAYLAHSARLLARVAGVIGERADAARYESLADRVTVAFGEEYVTPAGRLASDSQTAHALALCFQLLPTERQRRGAARRLRDLVAANEYHIGTGFLGTPVVCDALVDAGYVDDAFHLLMQTECPSWLYPVTMGATTVWERWDSMLPDGSINPGDMTSFNHYALGAIADFLHRRVAGLGPAAPGYSVLDVRPMPGGGLTEARASRRLPTGTARVEWHRIDSELELEVDVPPGHSARIALPDSSPPFNVGGGTHRLRVEYRAADQDPERPEPRSPFERLELDT